jgi:hypothetical protein
VRGRLIDANMLHPTTPHLFVALPSHDRMPRLLWLDRRAVETPLPLQIIGDIGLGDRHFD